MTGDRCPVRENNPRQYHSIAPSRREPLTDCKGVFLQYPPAATRRINACSHHRGAMVEKGVDGKTDGKDGDAEIRSGSREEPRKTAPYSGHNPTPGRADRTHFRKNPRPPGVFRATRLPAGPARTLTGPRRFSRNPRPAERTARTSGKIRGRQAFFTQRRPRALAGPRRFSRNPRPAERTARTSGKIRGRQAFFTQRWPRTHPGPRRFSRNPRPAERTAGTSRKIRGRQAFFTQRRPRTLTGPRRFSRNG
jgi:hypothetical protein